MEYNNILYEKYQRNDTSQCGEDGMIEELLRRLDIQKGVSVDIGASDGMWYSNTFNLVRNGWEVYEVEGNVNDGLPKFCQTYPNVKYKFCYVTDKDNENNVNKVLKELGCPKEIDLMSIDIDSIEYWIWDVLEFSPKVMVIEIEPRNYPLDMIYHNRDESIPKEVRRNVINPPQNITGAGPMLEMAKKKGYFLIGHTITNLFFLRKDMIERLKWPEVTNVEELSNFNPYYIGEENQKRWKEYVKKD